MSIPILSFLFESLSSKDVQSEIEEQDVLIIRNRILMSTWIINVHTIMVWRETIEEGLAMRFRKCIG